MTVVLWRVVRDLSSCWVVHHDRPSGCWMRSMHWSRWIHERVACRSAMCADTRALVLIPWRIFDEGGGGGSKRVAGYLCQFTIQVYAGLQEGAHVVLYGADRAIATGYSMVLYGVIATKVLPQRRWIVHFEPTAN